MFQPDSTTTEAPQPEANPQPQTEQPPQQVTTQQPPPTPAPKVDTAAREEFNQLLSDYVNLLPFQFTSRYEQLIDKYHPKS